MTENCVISIDGMGGDAGCSIVVAGLDRFGRGVYADFTVFVATGPMACRC